MMKKENFYVGCHSLSILEANKNTFELMTRGNIGDFCAIPENYKNFLAFTIMTHNTINVMLEEDSNRHT